MNYNVLLLTFKHYFHPLPPLVLVLPCKDVFKFGAVTFEMYTFTFNRNALLSLIDNHRLGPESEKKDKWFFFFKKIKYSISQLISLQIDTSLAFWFHLLWLIVPPAVFFHVPFYTHTEREVEWVSISNVDLSITVEYYLSFRALILSSSNL